MKKKILLTGASGAVGSQVLKQLFEEKERFDITVFDIKSPSAKKTFSPYKNEIHIVYGDISNAEDLQQISDGQDVIIHLAAIIPPLADAKPELAYNVNTLGTKRLIESLEKHSPDAFFIYSSSISVYGDRLVDPYINLGDPLIPSEGDEYAKTKIEAEKIIQNCKLNWSIFRLSAVMGKHKISKLMFHQPLDTSMEIITPEDTARAFIHAIDKQEAISKRIFNLGGGESCRISYEDFLTRSFDVFGLGEVDFKQHSFAEKNFHCGYYADGDELNDILDFRRDDLDDYFDREEKKVSPIKSFFASLFRKPILAHFQKLSEPLTAHKDKDEKMISRYFNRKKEED